MSSGGGGGGGDTTTVQKSEPWSKQKGFLEDIFREARKGYRGDPFTYFPDTTVAPFSPETEQALGAQTERATSGSPLTAASQDQLLGTIQGDYLDAGNPYFQQVADRVKASVQPQIDSRFAASGASGSPLANRALGLGLGDALGSLAYQNYGDERHRQMQSTMLAPQAAQQDYFDIAKLAETGVSRENLEQQQINEAVARHEFEQMEPWQRLQLYNQMVQGGYGGTTSGETNLGGGRSPVGSAMLGGVGGATTGAGLGMMIGGPAGAGIGAGAGGGLGLLSGLF